MRSRKTLTAAALVVCVVLGSMHLADVAQLPKMDASVQSFFAAVKQTYTAGTSSNGNVSGGPAISPMQSPPELRMRVEPITNQSDAPPFDEGYYIPKWRDEQERRDVALANDGVIPPSRPYVAVWDYACCGLGHRLSYASSKFHLTKTLNVTRLNHNWGSCPNQFSETGELPWIYEHLFGFGPLIVTPPETPIFGNESIVHPTTLAPNVSSIQPPLDLSYRTIRKNLVLDNECPMYTQYHRSRFDRKQLEREGSEQQRYVESRAQSDYEFYSQLWNRYRLRERAETFMQQHRFDEHTVFGIHIRAGNGEKGDFARKGRGISNIDVWVRNTVSLFRVLYQRLPTMTGTPESERKPPLLFVASDTGRVVHMLRNATVRQNDAAFHMKVVSFPQEYVAEGAGVSYAAHTKDGCLGSWDAQVADMGILSAGADVVVAGQSSSFSQTMPLSFSIGRNIAPDNMANKKLFCEVGQDGDLMECFNKISDWVLMEASFPLVALDGADKSRTQARKSFSYYNVPFSKYRSKFENTIDYLTFKRDNDKPRLTLSWGPDKLHGGRCSDIACKRTS